jgi:ribosome-binding factor A
LLFEVISKICAYEIRDPLISAVTLSAAKVSRDLRHARIYFNLLGQPEEKKDVLAGLKSATGFIRSKAAKQLNLRFVPTIEFFYDETEDEAQRIEGLLKQVKS